LIKKYIILKFSWKKKNPQQNRLRQVEKYIVASKNAIS